MSAVDDIRKVLQDIVSPDLKALDVRSTMLEKRLDGRIDGVDKKLDALDKKVDLRADIMDEKLTLTRDLLLAELRAHKAALEVSFSTLTRSLDLERRMAKIETEREAMKPQALEQIA